MSRPFFEAGFMARQGCGLNIFSRDQMDRIHETVTYILDKVGLGVHSDEALDIYAQGGCREMSETAAEKARQILADHQPRPLADGLAKEFEKIIASAAKG